MQGVSIDKTPIHKFKIIHVRVDVDMCVGVGVSVGVGVGVWVLVWVLVLVFFGCWCLGGCWGGWVSGNVYRWGGWVGGSTRSWTFYYQRQPSCLS